MKAFAFFFAGVIMIPMSPMAQTAPVAIDEQLGSGRNDLWVFGVKPDPKDQSVEVQLLSWKLPMESWGTIGHGWKSSHLVFAERPNDWDWESIAARDLYNDEQIHLSKYDERSAFSVEWGPIYALETRALPAGTILRFEDGHLKMIPNALKQARSDYGLSETQNFMGMVGNKVFYFDTTKSDRIFFFEKDHSNQRFEIIVPIRRWWSRSWKLEVAEQVFLGDKPDEILIFVWVYNHAWITLRPRRGFGGLPIDMKTAKPVSSGTK